MFLVCLNVKGTNYYVSSTGNDAAAGTIGAPWLSPAKVSSFFSSLSPGDSVLFKRGEIFYGQIIIGRSGTSGAPIIIGAYGVGAKPVITSFVTLTFTAVSTNIYESQALLPVHLNMVTKDGAAMAMGRWPQSTYKIFQTHNLTTSITDNTLTGSPNWTGAEMVLRRRRWVLDRDSITLHSANTITYTGGTAEPYNGYGYFIQNSAATLTYQNAWWYRKATKRLRIYSTTAPGTAWKAANISTLISNAGGFNYITFDNISLQGANDYGINTTGRIVFQNGDINFSGIDGARLAASSCRVSNSTISNSLNNGVTYAGGTDTTLNNTIYNSGMIAGMGQSGAEQYLGIYAANTGSYVRYNRVINSGYSGIYLNGNGSTTYYNYVDSFCIVKDDGSGIYTNSLTHTGRQIVGNIIGNGIGAPAGGGSATYQVNGIYSDNQSSNVLMRDNTVFNIQQGYGFYLHGGPNDKVRNNTVYNTKVALYIGEMVAGVTVNDSITNNIWFAISTSQMLSRIVLRSNRAPSTMGYFDSNYFCRPILEPNNINNSGSTTSGGVIAYTPGGLIPGYYSLIGGWQTAFSNSEVHSKKSPKGNDIIRFEHNASQVNKTINLQPYKWFDGRGITYREFLTLAPYTSVVLIRDSLLTTVVNQAPTVSSTLNHSITLPVSSTSLTATASDPESGTITYAWTKNSGPATFTIVSPTAATTSITGLVAGTYLFQIIVTDIGGLKDTAFTQVIVNAAAPVNAPPTVSAGTDATITQPLDSWQLNADATDSDGSIVSYLWTQISGPAATIDNTAIQNPTITLTTTGKRTFRVTVTDDLAATGYDEVDITVYSSVVNASVIIDDSINCNGGNASVTVSATGGTPGYTGTGTFVVSDGVHTYIVEDALGQKDTVSVTVTEPVTLSLGAATGTIATYLGSTTLTLTPTGGTANYSYSLDNVNWYTSPTFSISAGSYTARVRDANLCTASTNFVVTQPAPPPDIWVHPGRKKFRNLP